VIGPDTLTGLHQIQGGLTKAKAGARLKADVMGPTRHGLALRIGSETFLLNTKAELPQADKLTLQITTMRQGGEQSVQVLAADDQPLDGPLDGKLVARSTTQTSTPVLSTPTAAHQIEIEARPMTSDGKALGPPITIRLGVEAIAGGAANLHAADNHADHQQMMTSDDGLPAPARPASPVLMQNAGHRPYSAVPGGSPTGSVKAGSGSASTQLQQEASPAGASIPSSIDEAGSMTPIRSTSRIMVATVVAHLPEDKKTLLQTSDNVLLKIESPVELPIGSTLQMTLAGTSVPAFEKAQSVSPLTRLVELLTDIERSGQNTGGPEGHQKSHQLPMPDRQLATKLLQLMHLQNGDGREGAGLSSRDQSASSSSWANQLKGLLTEIGSSASEPLADGWRSTTLPLGPDPAQAIMINYREQSFDRESEPGEDDLDESPTQRAIFDVGFSHLGRCQIDALCQEQRFDLLVRTEQPLDHPVQEEITSIFLEASEIAGLSGEIGYQHGNFVHPATKKTLAKTMIT